MAKSDNYQLQSDTKGMWWDIMLYLPTVCGLGIGGAITWNSGSQGMAYVLLFLTFFFLYQGIHRLSGRLMFLGTSPVFLEVSKSAVKIGLKNQERVELVKDLRYFSDYAGKSFGLTGMDLQGAKRQYVFHKGQFVSEQEFKKIGTFLKVFG